MSTNIFDLLPFVFHDQMPSDQHEYIRIIGRQNNERVIKYVRRDYVNSPANLDSFKVVLPKAIGNGSFGETITEPLLIEPAIGSTETFLSIGKFDNNVEASNLACYLKSKFSRALLGVLKVTQDITPSKFKYVPLQDFTAASDIDWTKSVREIDRQLYDKYGLTEEERDFIETHVREME